MTRARVLLLLLAALTVIGLGATLFACSQNPTEVPIRTFERAQKVDVLCLRVFGDNAPEPLKQEDCAPVPPNVNGSAFTNQLFALVTQTSRGEVAVVDLSSGAIVDQSDAIPGLNFLPVGSNPTDIATTPDGRMAFVASAEPNKFAIYGIPGHRILGDKVPPSDKPLKREAATLDSWPVCALPQRPGALTVVPRRDANGVPPSDPAALAYELVAVLPGDRINSAKVVTIDPRPFLRANPRTAADGTVLDHFGDGPVLAPGQLQPCQYTAAIELSGDSAVPATFQPGAKWDDGVKWVDGGVDTTCQTPLQPSRCGLRSCKCVDPTTGLLPGTQITDAGKDSEAGVEDDAGNHLIETDAGACEPDASTDDVSERALDLGPLDPPQPLAIARDDQLLYIADNNIPLIHAIDLSVSGAPKELPPFVVSSLVDPSRTVSIRDIAVSPPTREYKRFLYAVDRKEGSIAVFDVSDPKTASRSPMRRPNPELNPFVPPDRLTFAAPVVAVAFGRRDSPIARIGEPNAQTGLLCNPNPAAPGYAYRATSTEQDVTLGPSRLRGIFAFATLSNGQIITIDVDDWDAPCRRPGELNGPQDAIPVPELATIPQPTPQAGDIDPYHFPIAAGDTVTLESFFPVSAPHRMRSGFFLRDDAQTGRHIPYLVSTVTLSSTEGTTPPLVGQGSELSPKIRPTAPVSRKGDPSATQDVGLLFSFDDPTVHFDQDWTVTYEGKLPGFDGLPATLATTDGYSSLVLNQPQGRFCAKGIEDWSVGGERANAIINALAAGGRPAYPERIDRRMVDYVQLTDDILPPGDPYWSQADLPEPDSCWEPQFSNATERFGVCAGFFGTAAEQNSNRDFPILEAYDDHLVIGRFGVPSGSKEGATREVIYKDASNAPMLKLMRCCFHHQINFAVRTGAEWMTSGTTVGFLSHVTRGDGGRCVPSCEPRQSLLNGRAPSLPSGPINTKDFAPFRDSPLAMRNPAFSFFIQNGRDLAKNLDVLPRRDMAFNFQTRGKFTPQLIDLVATSQTTSVDPQSMRFIDSLGQLAVVDAASQGLVLIDLSTITIARQPYF